MLRGNTVHILNFVNNRNCRKAKVFMMTIPWLFQT
jgi:hypothetical protein